MCEVSFKRIVCYVLILSWLYDFEEKANQENIVLQEYINEYKQQLTEESEERQSERTDLQGRIDDLMKQLEKVKVDAEAYAVAYF